MDKEKVNQGIRKLIEDFKANYSQYKRELEANTETKLIEPLFELLGWSKNDFEKQHKAHRGDKSGHADYAFKINDRVVFFLEAKKVGISLEKEADKQVISYALSKQIPLAISTNFEQMNIFCVEQENAINNVFRVFKSPDDYLNNFTDLMFLSKESFEQGLLLKKAEDEGRLKKRISINKPLLDDLMLIRKMIADDIEKRYSGKYELNEKEEIVQRIIDRLIFIRRSEDIGINPNDFLLKDITSLSGDKAYPKLKIIFKEYNEAYNSGLFAISVDNDCDKIAIDGEIIKKLVYLLYESKDKQYIYNFDWIDADVLGQVYEQYLGKILQQTKSGKAKLKDGQAHRKEQGIYYTPTYIVDYIVKNTVGELLKDKKIDVSKIKILDPACGSGSFLIKAFDYLYKKIADGNDAKQKKIDSQGTYSVKTDILKNNIYGVDLDNKAVEITKLNLLLKAAEKNRKLPEEVDLHIRHGNSLIDDESVAGLNAFKWEGDFKEESFDVVIGNPPYIRIHEFDEYIKKCFSKYASATGQYDIYVLFIEKALTLLKEGGLLGFIVSNKFLVSDYGIGLRRLILSLSKIRQIVDVSSMNIFKDASVYPIIIILEKTINNKVIESNKIKVIQNVVTEKGLFENKSSYYIQKEFNSNQDLIIDVSSSNRNILKKIEKETTNLGEITKIGRGFRPPPKEQTFNINFKEAHKYLLGKDLRDSYRISWSGNYVKYDNKKIKEAKPIDIFLKPKIMIRDIGKKFNAYYDSEGYLCLKTIYFVYDAKNVDLRFIIGILNSKVMLFYFKSKFSIMHIQGGYLRFRKQFLEKLPVKLNKDQKDIIRLVDKILLLNKRLSELGDKNTSETAKLKEDIQKIDKEIDELVYKIYDITEEEKRIMEESLR